MRTLIFTLFVANEALEVTSISFHGPTLIQSVIASLSCIVIAVLAYIALKYCGICKRGTNRGGLTEVWPEDRQHTARRWSLKSIRHQRPRDEGKNLANFERKDPPYLVP